MASSTLRATRSRRTRLHWATWGRPQRAKFSHSGRGRPGSAGGLLDGLFADAAFDDMKGPHHGVGLVREGNDEVQRVGIVRERHVGLGWVGCRMGMRVED